MCGRYTITFESADFGEELGLDWTGIEFTLRENVAPTQPVLACRNFATRQVEWMRWGLVPSWAKEIRSGAPLINARSETLLEKPSFREAFLKRRCLILADGFYEWQKFPGKQPSIPHHFSLQTNLPFFFAGLWDQWRTSNGETLLSCAIITGAANALVQPIHDRMPILLDQKSALKWLDPLTAPSELQHALQPYPAELMQEHIAGNLSGATSPTLFAL
jgi:Uncharacterized conserved protein